MKRLILICCSLISALLSFSSCGGSREMTPEKEAISGPLGKYFKVVNRSYKINDELVNIEIERIENGLPAPWEEGMEIGYTDNSVEPGFVVEFMDEDCNVIYKDQTSIVLDDDELVDIVALNVGESASIRFNCCGKKISKFKVSSTFKSKSHINVSTSTTSSSSYSSSNSSNTFDSALDEVYDEFDDVASEVIEVYKDAAKEVQDAYKEAAKEVQDAYMEAAEDLFDGLF